jgi:hypothetical protein
MFHWISCGAYMLASVCYLRCWLTHRCDAERSERTSHLLLALSYGLLSAQSFPL